MRSIIEIISPKEGLMIPKDSDKITIAKSNDVFQHIDPDFVSWGLNKPDKPAGESRVKVGEMRENADFREMFYFLAGNEDIKSLKKVCLLTQGQARNSVKLHHNWLRTDGFATFFLIAKKPAKKEKDFFVASVGVHASGELHVGLFEFRDGYRWLADYRHRLFVPHTADTQVS